MMKIPEFAENLRKSFELFFGSEVISEISFQSGEFRIEARLVNQPGWTIKDNPILYDIRIYIEDEIPVVKGISLELTGDDSYDYTPLPLEKAIVYIKEHLGTVESKTIYENF